MKKDQAKHNYEIAKEARVRAAGAYREAADAADVADRRHRDARDTAYKADAAFDRAQRDLTRSVD